MSATGQPLYMIADRILELLQAVDAADGEVTPDIAAQLDELTPTLDSKAEAYAIVYRALEAQASADAALAEYWTRRKEQKLAQRAALKQRLFAEMQRLGVTALGTPVAGARIQKSPPRLVLRASEADVMAAGYRRVVESVDRLRLLEALDAGDEIAKTLATLETGQHLRFR